MKKKMNKKKIVISTVSVLVVAAIAIGGFFLFQSKNTDPVDVYSVEMLNTSGWYEDESQLTGTITSDFIQEVYQDTSQQIKKVYVKEGDSVKVGDKLLKYNIDEKELDLKLQELQIKSSTFQIEKMEKELEKLKGTKATDSTTESTESTTTGSSGVVNASANLSLLSSGNILTVATATSDEPGAEVSETGEGGSEASSVVTDDDNGGSGDDENNGGSGDDENGGTGDDNNNGGSGDDNNNGGTGDDNNNGGSGDDNNNGGSGDDNNNGGSGDDNNNGGSGDDNNNGGSGDDNNGGESETKWDVRLSIPTAKNNTVSKGGSYQIKITVLKNDKVLSESEQNKLRFIGMLDDGYTDSSLSDDMVLSVGKNEKAETLGINVGIMEVDEAYGNLTVDVKGNIDPNPTPGGGGDPDPDPGSGYEGGDGGSGDSGDQTYTADELKDAISEKEADIAKAKQELGEAKISYKEAKKEVDEATIKATIKGTVTTAYTKKSAPSDGSPMIVVKAEDGIYVNTEVSELNLDTVKVGGTITCTSYETNETYEAKVVSVADYPTSGSNNEGLSNPNSSYYKVVAFIEDAGTLTTGQSVNVAYSAQSMGTTDADAICLQKAYIRTEGNQSYVYKKGTNGRLEKQYIKTGSTVYGQYMEVLDGLEWDDQIAFPYGKNVKDGAKTQLNEDMDSIIY